MTPGRAMLSAPVARSIPGTVRLPERADGGRAGFQFGRHPADLDVDGVLVGGGDHPLGPVAGGIPKSQRARSVTIQGLEGLVRRVFMQPSQFPGVGVEHHHPALAGELAREFASRLPGPDDDDPGQVVRPAPLRFPQRSRGGVQAWRQGVRTRCALRPDA